MNAGARRLIAKALMFAAVVTITAKPVMAQLQVTPFFTTYYPLGNLGTFDVVYAGQQGEWVQNPGAGVGLHLSYMFTDVIGVELGGTYVSSSAYTRACDLGSIDPDLKDFCLSTKNFSGNIIFGQVDLKYRPRNSNVFLLIGPGMVKRGGEAWDPDGAPSQFGVVAGIGVLARVAPKFALDVRLEMFASALDPDGDASDLESKFRPDLLLKVGIPLPSR